MQRSDREVGREDGLDRWGECVDRTCVGRRWGECVDGQSVPENSPWVCLARWLEWLDRWLTGWAGLSALVWIGVSLSSHSPWVCGIWRGDHLAELGMTGVRLIDIGGWIRALVLSLTRLLDRSFGSFFHSLAGSKGAFWFSLSLCCSFSHSLCVVLSLALSVFCVTRK